MKISYKFANEAVDIEIDEKWGNVLLDLNRQEYNNNQTETRRHVSLNAMDYEGEIFAQVDHDIASIFADVSNEEKLHKAIPLLKLKQQELVKAIFFEGVSVSAYAAKEGVSQPAISQRLETALKKLKRFF